MTDDKLDSNYDAHATAREGETTFTLQSGDPYAAGLIRLRAALLQGSMAQADFEYGALVGAMSIEKAQGNSYGEVHRSTGKLRLSLAVADEMEKERREAIVSDTQRPDV